MRPARRAFTLMPQGVSAWWLAANVTPTIAYQAKGAASLAASYVNLANPGVMNATPGVAPTFNAANGWTFNGTTQYLISGCIPTATATIMIQYTSFVGGTAFGSFDSGGSILYVVQPAGVTFYYGSSGVAVANAPALTAGNYGISAYTGYRNGVADPNTSAAGVGTGLTTYIGALNVDGVAGQFCDFKAQAFVCFASGINAAQIALMAAAMAAI